jgi:hypothetical protein
MPPETCRDEPEGREAGSIPPPAGNPSPAIARAYSAIVYGLLGGLYAEADRLMATAPPDPAPDRFLERFEEFGKHAHREGAKVKRLCLKAVRLSRRAQR